MSPCPILTFPFAWYEPGRPIEDVARELGLDPSTIIKLASNEIRLVISQGARGNAGSVVVAHIYPMQWFQLRQAMRAAWVELAQLYWQWVQRNHWSSWHSIWGWGRDGDSQ